MKKIFLLLTLFATATVAFAQMPHEADALRFSTTGISGSAAHIGKGGAIGALGNDIMSVSYNPAGIGFYQSSSFEFSTGMYFNTSVTDYNTDISDDYKINLMVGNLGLVLNMPTRQDNGWQNVQFTVGFNRLKSFGNCAKYHGEIEKKAGAASPDSYISTIIDGIVQSSDPSKDDFVRSGVIFYDSVGNTWASNFFRNSGVFEHLKSVTESGYLNEFALSLSGNYNNFLYLGATMGFPFINYSSSTVFSEKAYDDAKVFLDQYRLTQHHKMNGSGLNLKLGAIVRPLPWLRIGAAFHTPTFYGLTDEYFQGVERSALNFGGWFQSMEYKLKTPMKCIGSIAGIFGSQSSGMAGTISLDYEYQDYRDMRYRFENSLEYERSINKAMKENIFREAHKLGVGGELKLGKLALRAGYGKIGNPYKKNVNTVNESYFTLGCGYRARAWYFDVAYARNNRESSHYLYQREFAPKAELTQNDNVIMSTIGFRF